jgi:hypothetical protein
MSDRLPPDRPVTPHRRDLLRSLALAAPAGLTLATPAAHADDEPKTAPEALPTEVDARMALILARFGPQLDEDARRTVRDEIAAHVRRSEALRQIPLDNGTGPFPVFTPYRAPLK